MYQVYGLRVKGDDKVRYVGITQQKLKPRLANHISEKKNNYKNKWIRKHGAENIEIFTIEDGFLTREEVCVREIYYIKEFRLKYKLTNISDGGDGTTGFVVTDEHRKNISANHADVSGDKNPMYGKKHSLETRECISRANKGKKPSEETLNKFRKKAKGESNPNTSLTSEDVLEIRRVYSIGNIKQSELALQYGLTQIGVSKIVTRRTWKHI